MGLLKRLFSIGSKKGKKERPPIVHNVPLPEQSWIEAPPAVNDEEHEAAVGRLLRSSSTRYVEHATIDYTSLPPLPHPINKVLQIQNTAASSTLTVDTASLSRRGTYNVTVHKRRRHASTEFPHANSGMDGQPDSISEQQQKRTSLHAGEDSRVLRLRSDPSVASLIELYDEHGKLAQDAFSNSPPSTPKDQVLATEGRAQIKRNGSTLHQLLGATASPKNGDESDSVEGDISWAERFLAETEAMSSNSSLGLHTPTSPAAAELPQPEISFMTDQDVSNVTFDNPAISSMEVELSLGADASQDLDDLYKKNNPYSVSDPSTPQRASQVFEFLTKAKQSKITGPDLDRTLPELPSCFSSPSDENASREHFPLPTDLANFQFNPTRFSVIPMPLVEETPRRARPHSALVEGSPPMGSANEPRSAFSDDSHDIPYVPPKKFIQLPETPISTVPTVTEDKQNAIKVILNGETKVIVTAPTPGTNPPGPSRIPRGPRAPPRRSSGRRRSALGELSNSPSKPSDYQNSSQFAKDKSLKRSNSQSSNRSHHSSRGSWDRQREENVKKQDVYSVYTKKENHLGLSVKADIPATPLRSHSSGSRSLLRSVVEQAMFRPPVDAAPSPASSSDLSPVGRQMMTDVRQQRMKAREVERSRSANRYAQKI